MTRAESRTLAPGDWFSTETEYYQIIGKRASNSSRTATISYELQGFHKVDVRRHGAAFLGTLMAGGSAWSVEGMCLEQDDTTLRGLYYGSL